MNISANFRSAIAKSMLVRADRPIDTTSSSSKKKRKFLHISSPFVSSYYIILVFRRCRGSNGKFDTQRKECSRIRRSARRWIERGALVEKMRGSSKKRYLINGASFRAEANARERDALLYTILYIYSPLLCSGLLGIYNARRCIKIQPRGSTCGPFVLRGSEARHTLCR